jgi:MFS family permease
LGSLTAGQFADRFGRKLPILIAYTTMTIVLFMSVIAPNFYVLVICRTILGFFVGKLNLFLHFFNFYLNKKLFNFYLKDFLHQLGGLCYQVLIFYIF